MDGDGRVRLDHVDQPRRGEAARGVGQPKGGALVAAGDQHGLVAERLHGLHGCMIILLMPLHVSRSEVHPCAAPPCWFFSPPPGSPATLSAMLKWIHAPNGLRHPSFQKASEKYGQAFFLESSS